LRGSLFKSLCTYGVGGISLLALGGEPKGLIHVLEKEEKMSKLPILMVSVLATLMAGSAAAADTSNAAPASAPAASVVLPDAITSQLTPEPAYKYGVQSGPCTVSVTCIGNYPINCYGDTVCYWRVDSTNPYSRGFVECDGSRLSCSAVGDVE